MHSTRHDPHLAALHAGANLPGHVLDVVVLTADAGLLATLREASGPEHAIWQASTAEAAVDLLVGGRCGILIADLAALRADAASLLERLQAQFPELVLMATGRREEEIAVASQIGSGLVYRFLHKPVSPPRAGLFITAATRRYYELRHVEPIGMTTVKTIAARPHMRKVLAGILAAVVVGAAFLAWRALDRTATLSVPASPIAAPSTAEQIEDLLARAQIAVTTDRLAEPRGDNALEYYRSVLALQPNHAQAQAGVTRVAAALEARLLAALQARDAPAGVAALNALQRAQPDHPRLDALQADLIALSRSVASAAPPAEVAAPGVLSAITGRGRTEGAVATGAREPTAGATQEMEIAQPQTAAIPGNARESPAAAGAPAEPDAGELQRIVQLRESGALIEPASANAYDRLLAVRDRFPEADEVRAESQRLALALLDRARTALVAKNLQDAATFLSHADVLVPGMSTTRSMRQELATAQRQHAFETNVVQATKLERVNEVAAEYPREAARDGLEGWVDVEFTVATDGSTQDLVVRDAQNREAFEEAALDSVRGWRFEPVMRNGEAVPQRAILRVRFVLR